MEGIKLVKCDDIENLKKKLEENNCESNATIYIGCDDNNESYFNIWQWLKITEIAANRGKTCYDSSTKSGVFTKKLADIMKQAMSSSPNYVLTDLFVSKNCFNYLICQMTKEKRLYNIDHKIYQQIIDEEFGARVHITENLGKDSLVQRLLSEAYCLAMVGDKQEYIIGMDISHFNDRKNPLVKEEAVILGAF
jgi:hypothetical protein